MPKRRTKEADAAYEREYYHRTKDTPAGKERIRKKVERTRKRNKERYHTDEEYRKAEIARITRNKRLLYGGTCKVCGVTTLGRDKQHPGSDYCAEHRSEQWAAKMETKRLAEIKEATLRVPESKRPYVPKMTQEKLAQASHKTPAFSRLVHNEDRDQDGKNESPPAPRRWASP